MSGSIFRDVILPTRPRLVFDIAVESGKIAAIERGPGPARWVALPALADMHLHANRAFTLGSERPRDFEHAIALVTAMTASFDSAAYERQARRLFARLVEKGTARGRTHADLGRLVGDRAVTGTLAARDAYSGRLDVEIVAFASHEDDPADPATAAMLRDARAAGADLLGAVPAFYADPGRSIDAILDLALELQCGVDLHLDEHLDAARSYSEYLAHSTARRGLAGRVTLSHGCAISMLAPDRRRRIARAIAEAGITVITLPATNLYLQDRGGTLPSLRGMTAVQDLLAEGAQVRIASDNVQDVFYPYGSGDLLDMAALAATAGHIEDSTALIAAICAGRTEIRPGDPADFILIEGGSLAEVIANRPATRQRVHRGETMTLP